MSLATVTTRGFLPASASLAEVVLAGYSNGAEPPPPPPPPDVVPSGFYSQPWGSYMPRGRDDDDEERNRRRKEREIAARREIGLLPPEPAAPQPKPAPAPVVARAPLPKQAPKPVIAERVAKRVDVEQERIAKDLAEEEAEAMNLLAALMIRMD